MYCGQIAARPSLPWLKSIKLSSGIVVLIDFYVLLLLSHLSVSGAVAGGFQRKTLATAIFGNLLGEKPEERSGVSLNHRPQPQHVLQPQHHHHPHLDHNSGLLRSSAVATETDSRPISSQGGQKSSAPNRTLAPLYSHDQNPNFSPPPPPPPPPMLSQHSPDNDDTAYQMVQNPPPPPQQSTSSSISNTWNEWDNFPYYPSTSSMPRNAPSYNDHTQVDSFYHQLQNELENSLQQQRDLRDHADNLTHTIAILRERDDLHLRQLEILTERVIDVEATAAFEHNQFLEARANCTEMAKILANVTDDLKEWQARCHDSEKMIENNMKELDKIKKELKTSMSKTEELATLIERHRLNAEEVEETFEVLNKKKKEGGFLTWLFGWRHTTNDDVFDDDDENDLESTYDSARATLLEALRNERNNVDELETMVSILQQNNTAIAEQFQSKDILINDLKERVVAFEEDKVVLKAAFRQLQKESNEEMRKSKKILLDLEASHKEIKRLQMEIKKIAAQHNREVQEMHELLTLKQQAMQKAESNLTMVATYVDRLENRLADFAVKRREIESREAKCLEVEKLAANMSQFSNELKEKVMAYEQEHTELKGLLKEMADERSKLKAHIKKISLENDEFKKEHTHLQTSLSSLQSKYQDYELTNDDLQKQIRFLEVQANRSTISLTALRQELNQTETNLRNLQYELEISVRERIELMQKLNISETSRTELQLKLSLLQEKVTMMDMDVSKETAKLNSELLTKVEKMEAEAIDRVRSFEATSQEKLMKLEAKALERIALMKAQAKEEISKMRTEALEKERNTTTESFHHSEKNALDARVLKSNEVEIHLTSLVPVINSVGFISTSSLKDSIIKRESVNVTKPTHSSNSNNKHVATSNIDFNRSSLSSEYGYRNTRSWNASHLSRNVTIPRNKPSFSINRTKRKVPFRTFRKFCSKLSGVHGIITKPSSRRTDQLRYDSNITYRNTNKNITNGGMVSKSSKKITPVNMTNRPQLVRGQQGNGTRHLMQKMPLQDGAVAKTSQSMQNFQSNVDTSTPMPSRSNQRIPPLKQASHARAATPTVQKRHVPLRTVRKKIAKVTGVHGFFSRSGHQAYKTSQLHPKTRTKLAKSSFAKHNNIPESATQPRRGTHVQNSVRHKVANSSPIKNSQTQKISKSTSISREGNVQSKQANNISDNHNTNHFQPKKQMFFSPKQISQALMKEETMHLNDSRERANEAKQTGFLHVSRSKQSSPNHGHYYSRQEFARTETIVSPRRETGSTRKNTAFTHTPTNLSPKTTTNQTPQDLEDNLAKEKFVRFAKNMQGQNSGSTKRQP